MDFVKLVQKAGAALYSKLASFGSYVPNQSPMLVLIGLYFCASVNVIGFARRESY